jgi:hypothetical protein
MANKQELIDKIQTIAKRVYAAKTTKGSLGISPNDVNFDAEKFPILSKFSTLKHIIVNLLTDQYELFIKDVMWVAPRPTTFKIILANGQAFYMIYTEHSWIAQIEGKKYYLLNISDEENAASALARVLRYGKPKTEEEISGEVPIGDETPLDEPIPEPGMETPPIEPPAEPTEEVPEELPV